MNKKILIVGTGAYGTALAELLIQNPNNNVNMYGIDQKEVDEINTKHTNSKYFKSIKLNSKIRATTNFEAAIDDIEIVMLVTPSETIIKIVEKIFDKIGHSIIWVNLSKGFDYKNNELISTSLKEKIPKYLNKDICKISGPTFALEMMEKAPTSFTIACNKIEIAKYVQEAFDIKNIVTEITDDILGVELVSVIKNPLAIFLGIINGLNLQTNGMAMFLVFAIREMSLFKKAYPSIEDETLLGFSGLGDLFLTGTSKNSRNFSLGVQIGETNHVDEKKWANVTMEGIRSINIFVEIAEKNGIKLLLLPTLKLIFENKGKPKKLIEDLIININNIN